MNLAVQLAVIREAEKRIKEAKDTINAALLAELDEGDAKAAKLDDGTKLGKASVIARKTPKVTDEAALTEWVAEHYPSEVVTTTAIRESFLHLLKEQTKTHGHAFADEGEIAPGLELVESAPFVSFRSEKGAGEAIDARWNELIGPVLLLGEGN